MEQRQNSHFPTNHYASTFFPKPVIHKKEKIKNNKEFFFIRQQTRFFSLANSLLVVTILNLDCKTLLIWTFLCCPLLHFILLFIFFGSPFFFFANPCWLFPWFLIKYSIILSNSLRSILLLLLLNSCIPSLFLVLLYCSTFSFPLFVVWFGKKARRTTK